MKLTIAIWLISAVTGFAGNDTELTPPITLHLNGRTIIIPQRDQNGPRDWNIVTNEDLHTPNSMKGLYPSSTVHAYLSRNEITYVVCSTGSNIYWMAISDGAVVKHQTNELSSSWRPISGNIVGWQNGLLLWSASGMILHEGGQLWDEDYTGYFDPKEPEKGLQLKERKVRSRG